MVRASRTPPPTSTAPMVQLELRWRAWKAPAPAEPRRRARARRCQVARAEQLGLRWALLERRPQTRAECRDGFRPCPWAGCPYHLKGDVIKKNQYKDNFPHLEVWEMGETCALDIAERHRDDERPLSLDKVAVLMGISRPRVQQNEQDAFRKLRGQLGEELVQLIVKKGKKRRRKRRG